MNQLQVRKKISEYTFRETIRFWVWLTNFYFLKLRLSGGKMNKQFVPRLSWHRLISHNRKMSSMWKFFKFTISRLTNQMSELSEKRKDCFNARRNARWYVRRYPEVLPSGHLPVISRKIWPRRKRVWRYITNGCGRKYGVLIVLSISPSLFIARTQTFSKDSPSNSLQNHIRGSTINRSDWKFCREDCDPWKWCFVK